MARGGFFLNMLILLPPLRRVQFHVSSFAAPRFWPRIFALERHGDILSVAIEPESWASLGMSLAESKK
jgi:hypothetical protein